MIRKGTVVVFIVAMTPIIALGIVLLLHMTAVGGIYLFNLMKR